jgi:hypothetical protein
MYSELWLLTVLRKDLHTFTFYILYFSFSFNNNFNTCICANIKQMFDILKMYPFNDTVLQLCVMFISLFVYTHLGMVSIPKHVL